MPNNTRDTRSQTRKNGTQDKLYRAIKISPIAIENRSTYMFRTVLFPQKRIWRGARGAQESISEKRTKFPKVKQMSTVNTVNSPTPSTRNLDSLQESLQIRLEKRNVESAIKSNPASWRQDTTCHCDDNTTSTILTLKTD